MKSIKSRLSAADDQIHILKDSVSTLALGRWKLVQDKEV